LVESIVDVRAADGRVLKVHDGSPRDHSGPVILWHHGSPQTGALLDPLLVAAEARGVRLLSYGRPSYGGSSSNRGRDVASAAADVAAISYSLGLERFAVMGASGGGPHALACAALLPGRISAVACIATLAPRSAEGFDWFAGMAADGISLRTAIEGRAAREAFAELEEFDPTSFNDRDYAALDGGWASLGADVSLASKDGPEGIVDDDLAYVNAWGFDVAAIDVPALFVHGGDDRVVPASHSQWLVHQVPNAELWLRPRDGHVAALDACPLAMDWLLSR
jgi:pimeloyl-ACP methyl ester carboxylesterase